MTVRRCRISARSRPLIQPSAQRSPAVQSVSSPTPSKYRWSITRSARVTAPSALTSPETVCIGSVVVAVVVVAVVVVGSVTAYHIAILEILLNAPVAAVGEELRPVFLTGDCHADSVFCHSDGAVTHKPVKSKPRNMQHIRGFQPHDCTLRHFTEQDMAALHLLLQDEAVNTFLPWFPMKNIEQTQAFYRARMAGKRYCFAVCFQGAPVGYIQADEAGCHDLGYALRREFWHRGFATEAGRALVGLLKADGVPYITATHDRNNPASGRVMRRLGMRYCYSYEEQWQPKNIPVVFRMYQLNLDGQAGRVYRGYWNRYEKHCIEAGV